MGILNNSMRLKDRLCNKVLFLQKWGCHTGYTRSLNSFVLPGLVYYVKGEIAQPYIQNSIS